MGRHHWFRRSLAWKISLLFGTSVLLIIIVTLVFPWLQMTALNEQAILLQAKRVASVAYQAVDLREPSWIAAQARLRERWAPLVGELDLPLEPPQLVAADSVLGTGFRRDAVGVLRRNREQRYYWRLQQDETVFRLAMGIRGTDADAHPHLLRGIIDVRLPISRGPGVWNLVVTVLAGASGAVLAILVFYMVTQRLVLSPVHVLRRLAERVTSGDISVRSSISSHDEFEQLSDAFNEMLMHLKSAQDEQEKINRSLDVRLGELAETNVALSESNRLKSEFLTNVTHELRTPLVSIIGFAELLQDARENPNADRRRLDRYSRNILTSGRSLLEIINDLLDLAKIEAGKMELHLLDFSLAELCSDLIDFVRPLAEKRNQRLALELGEDLPTCHSDSGKIKQILYNLLSNAVKFTPTGGGVSLSVSRNGDDRFRLVVSDTGPGIPEDQREAIFEKFLQLDSSRTREHGGTGLGLAITSDLVQVLGGRIELAAQPGPGASFLVELPTSITGPSPRTRTGLM